MVGKPTQGVFIAGAGPVGLTAALELARRGVASRMVDPDKAVSPESRALAINSRTLDLLEPSGVTERLLAAGQRIRHVVFRRGDKVIAQIPLAKIPHRHNFLLVLAQSRTEEILAQRFAELGGKLERGLALTSFVAGRELELNLSDGSTAKADVLIGADGARSTVRRAMGLDFPGNTQEEMFGLCDAVLDDWPFPFDTIVVSVYRTHLAPFIPMGEGFGRFITTQPFLREALPTDAKIRSIGWQTDFRIGFRQAQTYQKDNVFLAGDAAHIHSPVGGRGMNLGIEDACWLAFLHQEKRLGEYTALRHPVGANVLKLTHRLTALANANGVMRDVAMAIALPIIQRSSALQRRVFNNLTALDTPPPPWL